MKGEMTGWFGLASFLMVMAAFGALWALAVSMGQWWGFAIAGGVTVYLGFVTVPLFREEWP